MKTITKIQLGLGALLIPGLLIYAAVNSQARYTGQEAYQHGWDMAHRWETNYDGDTMHGNGADFYREAQYWANKDQRIVDKDQYIRGFAAEAQRSHSRQQEILKGLFERDGIPVPDFGPQVEALQNRNQMAVPTQ